MGGRRRGGFVMPMVILLMLVAGLTIGIMLTRQGAQTRTVERQVRGYQNHHASRGIQEAIGAWSGRVRGDVHESVGEDGHFMDLLLDGGAVARLYGHEAQGTLLADVAGLGGDTRTLAVRALLTYERMVDIQEFGLNTRTVGTWRVSPYTATPDVRRAVVESVVGQDGPVQEIVAEMERAIQNDELDTTIATRIFNNAGLPNDEAIDLRRVFDFDPVLWFVWVEIRPSARSERVVSAFGGLTVLGEERDGVGRQGLFLEWRELDGEDLAVARARAVQGR